jgi:RHS repeat-associated protein
MRTRVAVAIILALILTVAIAIANYQPFVPSAYWTNTGTFLNIASTYMVSQTNSPDSSSDYQLTSSTLATCQQTSSWWEIDHHLLRATSGYNFSSGSAYDIIYDSNRCTLNGNPRLYVYKVVSGSPTLLLNVELAGSQAGQQFVTFIRNSGTNPGIHIKLGFNEWHVSDTSITTGYPGYAFTDGTNTQNPPGVFALEPAYRESDTANPTTPTSLQTAAWPTIIDLQWTASTDADSGVTNYLLYKNGVYVTSIPATDKTYSFGGLSPSTSYTLGVAAQDRHFNVSTTATVNISTTAHSPNVPVVPTRLGVHRFSQSWGAGELGEAIDTLSGNLNFTMPAFSISLRGGGAVPFAFIYNGQIWRKDNTIVKRLAGDLGYGHGWRLQAGAITPIWNGSAFSHFVFTDSTGAEYALATNTGGVWTGKDGAYISYDQNTRRLWFNSGIFWQMDCISGSTEVDAGTRYPTRIQNANGNYVDITYKAAIGGSTANTSARINNVTDLRGQMLYLSYNADAIPHVTNINSTYGGLQRSFTYSSGTLTEPFSSGSYGTQKQLATMVIPSTPSGSNYAFTYNGSGEMTVAKLPKGGEFRYNYTTTALANSVSIRELSDRRLVKQSGASEVVYTLVRDSADSSQVMHSSLELTDPSGVGRKRWLFSTANDYTRGFLTEFYEHPTSSGNSNILRKHTYTYTQDANQMPYVASVTTDLDPGTADAKTMKTDQTVDVYGNVTQARIYEYGSLSTPARTTTCSYYAPGSHYIRNLPTACNTTDGTNTVNLFTNTYDSYGGSNPLTQVTGTPTMHATGTYSTAYTVRGNPTQLSGPAKSTVLTYNILGEVIKAVTNGQTVQWNYSSSNNFGAPTSITPNSNANLAMTMNWNSLLQPTSSSTPNGNSSSATYDSLNRPLTQTNGDGIQVAISYLDDVNQSLSYSTTTKVRTTYDGLGRPIKVENLDPSNNAVKSIVDTEYDSCACSPVGKLKRQSMPYASGGTVLWTNYVYYGLGRTLQIVQPHTSGSGSAGTSTYAYAGNKVTVTDPAGRWKRYLQNALGNLVQVTEPNPAGGANFETYYTYNIRNQLTQVQMPRPDQIGGTYNQTRTFVYNLTTGLLTSATNPENGTTTYDYAAITYLLNYKLDAKGQKLEYTYDSNNRVTKITPRLAPVAPATVGEIEVCNVIEYFYDLGTNTYGRLAAVQYGSKDLNGSGQIQCPKGLHREEFTYTNGGRPTSKTLKLTRKFADLSMAERTAEMAISYDYMTGTPPTQLSSPNLQKVTYPTTHTQTGGSGQPVLPLTGSIYQYSYDSMGRPTGETRTDPSQSPVTIVDQVTYNTFGALTQMRKTLASQTETRSYDAFQRMTSMTQFDGTAITYNYSQTANDGKLVSQVTGSESVNYTYDSLGRLSQAATAGGGGWGLSWTYDGWGNRLQQSAVKGTVPTMVSVTDPATNRIQAHTYDANGNTVNTPQQGAMTYDVMNRLTTVASDVYGYDAANNRVWKNDEFTFWGAAGERIGRYSAVKLVDNASVHVFVFQKVTVDEYFRGRRLTTQDRLGSVGSYYPYGEAKAGTVSNADSLATYYRDSTGLDYARQRYFQPAVGRFTTPDPYRASAKRRDPQTFNRYPYVGNDPVNGVDPSGLETIWVFRVEVVDISSAPPWWEMIWYPYFGRHHLEMPVPSPEHPLSPSPVEVDEEPVPTAPSPSSVTIQTGQASAALPPCQTISPPSTIFPQSLGGSLGSIVEAGVGSAGVSGQSSIFGGLFVDYSNTGQVTGGSVISGGAVAYGFGQTIANPPQVDPYVFGAVTSGGLGLTISNAGNQQQLTTTTTTSSFNIGLGFNYVGLSLSTGNGVWALTINPPMLGGTSGVGVSQYATTTVTTVPPAPCSQP